MIKFLETIKAVDGELKHLNYHQKRVNKTLKESSLILKEVLTPPQNGTYRCRVIYDSRDIDVSYHLYKKSIAKSFKLVHADTLDYHLKYAKRDELESLKSQNSTYDDIIIVKNGCLTDTTIANIAFLKDEQWITPKKPLLRGTTRERLIEENLLHVKDISIDDIDNFTAFGIMNALLGFVIIEDGIMSIKK